MKDLSKPGVIIHCSECGDSAFMLMKHSKFRLYVNPTEKQIGTFLETIGWEETEEDYYCQQCSMINEVSNG